ncbi:CHC2 zinc finger domain-containing protein [Peribacillus loiseleuriae]|uniref:CHC2 zinc finger domain-containing protein n=1 Tax=Peribacillus loiseleuriae TaxID=1679170 RepID=UPI003D0943A8
MARISQKTIDDVRNVSIVDVATALGHSPKKVGKQYRVYCPNPTHRENPDTYIEAYKNIFKCFGNGGCGAGGNNSLSYYSWHEYGSADKRYFVNSIEGVANLMGIPIEYEDGTTQEATQKRECIPRTIQKEIPAQSDAVCDKVYRAFLSLCPIRKEHAKEWMETRQYSKDEIITIGLRSVPTPQESVHIIHQLICKGYPLERVPGFSQRFIPDGYNLPFPKELLERDDDNKGYWVWMLSAGSGYFIPVRNRKGQIVRLRVRRDQGNHKYIWFSSSDNTTIETNKLKWKRKGASSGAPINVVPPISQIKIWEVGTDLSEMMRVNVVLAVEGEHNSIISANKIGIPVTGAPGIGNFKDIIPLLKDWGSKKFIIANDMDILKREDDSEKSKKKQKTLMEKLKELATEVMKLDIEVLLWTWDIRDGNGLDDLLLQGKLPIEINLRSGAHKKVELSQLHIA